MTAASPFWRGYIADVDCRWNVIAGSVDDRTVEERGIKVNSILQTKWCFIDYLIAFERGQIPNPKIPI